MKKEIILIFLLLISFVNAQNLTQETNIYSDIGDVKIDEDPGLTPDSELYFIDNIFESILVGDNPKKALLYKEEKIAEVRLMIEQGKIEDAKKALEKYEDYNDILEKEVSPEIEKESRETSKAVKEFFDDVKDNIKDEEILKIIEKSGQTEDKIALAAKISKQVETLCKSLSELDPLQYERVCKTDKEAPKWQKELDKKLTKEQEEEAKEFFGIMSQCFKNPKECQCSEIKISSFAEQCSIIAPLAAECMEGNQESCEKMEEVGDPIELLPFHLQEVMEEVEKRYGESQYDLYIPQECKEAQALDRESCMKVMFKLNAPEECVAAFESGEIDIKNEREAREKCEEIMFKTNAPEECIEAGLKDPKECSKLMFKTYAPQECIDAGLTGELRSNEKKCREIMEGQDKVRREGPHGPAPGFNCKGIENSEERLKCFDLALERIGFEGEDFEKREEFRRSEEGFPPQCKEANALTRESCEEVMKKIGQERRRDFEEERQKSEEQFRKEFEQYRPIEEFRQPVERKEFLKEGEISNEGFIPPEGIQQESSPNQETSGGSSESSSESQPSSSGESSGSQESQVTGQIVFIDNKFLAYYFKNFRK
ncbi:MAG: hypothetical protein AABX61_02785 [Nanoarchaeota archaeon]